MDGQEQSRVLNNRQDKERRVYLINTSFMGVYTCYHVVASSLYPQKGYYQLLSNGTASDLCWSSEWAAAATETSPALKKNL